MAIDLHKVVATVMLTAILGVTGLAFFVWMGVTGWKDTPGVVMAIIFVATSVLQAVFTVGWWRHCNAVDAGKNSYDVGREMEEMVQVSDRKALEAAS